MKTQRTQADERSYCIAEKNCNLCIMIRIPLSYSCQYVAVQFTCQVQVFSLASNFSSVLRCQYLDLVDLVD